VIDSLNGYAFAMPDEQLLSVHLHELCSYLSQRSVTSVLTMTQHGLISDEVQQPFDISYVADTVLLFRPFEFAGEIHKAVSVYKNRAGPHETAIRELRMGTGGIELGEPLMQFRGILRGVPDFVGQTLGSAGDHGAATR
jgi:circadian clock protein KaiC